tara:strand:+ start:586 stop:1215 length:630 start_codon:yes stop_codon:yes gene_type:complete
MKENPSHVEPIFAHPIFICDLDNNLNDDEFNFLEKQKKHKVLNKGGNYNSKNTYILREKEMIKLNQKLQDKVKEYFEVIVCTSDDVDPYITQSWLNWTNEGEAHHEHYHANSLISGVYYIDCIENIDSIIFEKPNQDVIQFSNFKSFNIFNSRTWELNIKNNSLILFPSFLKHSVKMNKLKHTRTSLAFNVFVKGVIGDKNYLTELEIK